eukprot:20122-Heterococcus_DN1.PRE.3
MYCATCESESASGTSTLQLQQQRTATCRHHVQIAADRGRLTMCKYLHSEGCPWDTAAPHWAAYSGHVDTLRWLHEQNCPWSTAGVAAQAGTGGSIEAMRYVLHEAALATPELLTEMLNAAGAHEQLEAAQWLRQQGAEWPRVLQHEGTLWNDECLPWARQQGCTAPLYDYESDSDGSDFSRRLDGTGSAQQSQQCSQQSYRAEPRFSMVV